MMSEEVGENEIAAALLGLYLKGLIEFDDTEGGVYLTEDGVLCTTQIQLDQIDRMWSVGGDSDEAQRMGEE